LSLFLSTVILLSHLKEDQQIPSWTDQSFNSIILSIFHLPKQKTGKS